MKALIETTIQINRIFKSKQKAAINKFMSEHECYIPKEMPVGH